MIAKLNAVWSSLPHPVQAIILAFVTAAGTAFLQAIETGNCLTVACLKHSLAGALLAGVAAARAFYMVPNRSLPPAPPNPAP